MSANQSSVRHPIQSEKMGMLSLACRLFSSRTLRILTMSKKMWSGGAMVLDKLPVVSEKSFEMMADDEQVAFGQGH